MGFYLSIIHCLLSKSNSYRSGWIKAMRVNCSSCTTTIICALIPSS
ncbi:hypothetical protein MGSAQ_000696 [marine sediment metagenome]|uniref:Uncharacterized protein n=1 Tax=marine sediment metagenome TaxID=412755 RepID=A0A1B6NYE8_9ZZZZ